MPHAPGKRHCWQDQPQHDQAGEQVLLAEPLVRLRDPQTVSIPLQQRLLGGLAPQMAPQQVLPIWL
jgi:hypothetical protein